MAGEAPCRHRPAVDHADRSGFQPRGVCRAPCRGPTEQSRLPSSAGHRARGLLGACAGRGCYVITDRIGKSRRSPRMRLSSPVFVTTVLVASLLSAPVRAEPRVVVTIKPIHALVAAVMQGVGNPHLLIDGMGSPHTYALKPSDARALQQADLVVRVSPGLETFLDRPLRSLPAAVRVLTLVKAPGLVLLPLRGGSAFDTHEHAAAHDHPGDANGLDPHLWLDPDNAVRIVRYVAETLAEIAPATADTFKANADAEVERISRLKSELQNELRPLSGSRFIVFHDAYQYFEHAFHLSATGALTVSPDVQPSARRLTELRRKIAGQNVACVFAEPQFEPRLLRTIVEGTQARIGVLDPLGASLAPGPDMYEKLLRGLASSLAQCLGP
jgi:zinc transport system substrate-binding protein